MDKRWSTIRNLRVFVEGDLKNCKPDIWDPLQRPAPLLQSFVLSFKDSDFVIFTASDNPLSMTVRPCYVIFPFVRRQKPNSPTERLGWGNYIRWKYQLMHHTSAHPSTRMACSTCLTSNTWTLKAVSLNQHRRKTRECIPPVFEEYTYREHIQNIFIFA